MLSIEMAHMFSLQERDHPACGTFDLRLPRLRHHELRLSACHSQVVYPSKLRPRQCHRQ